MRIWYAKIGFADEGDLPLGADRPMRQAIRKAYIELTGKEPHFIFSGWGGQLTFSEKEVLEGEGLVS